MPVIVNLEGSEEDFAKLLILHQIVTEEQLAKALQLRQTTSAKAGAVESLRETLLREHLVSSSLIFEVLRVASKVVEECTKCGAIHHIYFYHPHSRYFCTYCKGPLKVTDAGQALKWTPGQLAAAAAKAAAAGGPPPSATQIIRRANPLDDPSVAGLPAADETMLDMGLTSKPKPAPRPAALPPQTPKPPIDPTVTILPVGGDETMLDMGATPKPKTMKPAAPPSAPAAPPAPAASKPKALPDETLRPLPTADETMLDMGVTPKAGSAKPPAAAAPPPAPAAAKPADPDQSIVPAAMGDETMLDMGTRPAGKPLLLPGEKPEFPAIPKEGAKPLSDFTTSVIPGKTDRAGTSSTQSATVTSGPDTSKSESTVDPTLMMTPPTASTRSESISSVDKTQIQNAHTPKSGSGMGASAALANAKAMPAEAAQAAKDPARVFGKYVLLSELGRGGAGVVYKAWDTLLLQYVALKFIRNQEDTESDSTSGSSQIEEFQREARLSVRLRHPNIVRIYEMGCMSNRYYLSMEYIEGGNLLALIHGGKEKNQKTKFNTNPEMFLKIMINISLGVDYAHHEKQPVVHRDLKPHNVLVDKSNNPYVVDFGLAKEVESGDGATLTGVVKGTPTYMAPEQAEGRNRDVDLRTDVYALGAILYEMLTGRPPFLGESVPEILRKIATELPERPNEVIAKAFAAEAAATSATATATSSKAGKSKNKGLMVAKTLETICLKALEKNKADRYQTAKEFAEDIDRYMKGEDILATEPNLWRRFRRTVRRHPILSGITAALLFAGVTGSIVAKATRNPVDNSGKVLLQGIIERGEKDLKDQDWAGLKVETDNLFRQDRTHPKIAAWEKATADHKDLVEKTEREWKAELDRVSREPLSQVLPPLRKIFKLLPELQPKMREAFRIETGVLEKKVLEEARRLVGSGARPAWVEEIIKKGARDAKDQADMLLGLTKDPDFPFPVDKQVEEAREGLGRVIAYQGTWSLLVNVAPFAEVSVVRAEKEVTSDFTPVGIQDLEVVGSSYLVELFWPSKENPKVSMKQEISDLHHGQTVVIRGDISKSTLKQERK
jgi:serine/threonine protein kinase